jgi:hypothetical protein
LQLRWSSGPVHHTLELAGRVETDTHLTSTTTSKSVDVIDEASVRAGEVEGGEKAAAVSAIVVRLRLEMAVIWTKKWNILPAHVAPDRWQWSWRPTSV